MDCFVYSIAYIHALHITKYLDLTVYPDAYYNTIHNIWYVVIQKV